MANRINEFSEFECKSIGIKFGKDQEYSVMELVGGVDEELESKKTVKKGRGVVVKQKVRGTGNGTVKVTGHVPYDLYNQMYGMNLKTLVEGVKGYGINSLHPTFSMTCDVFDEDDMEKLKAYPNCVLTSGVARKIENGGEEVAEIELEVSVMPDEFGQGMYEALVENLADDALKTDWLTKFEPSMAQKTETPTA